MLIRCVSQFNHWLTLLKSTSKWCCCYCDKVIQWTSKCLLYIVKGTLLKKIKNTEIFKIQQSVDFNCASVDTTKEITAVN